MNRAIPLFVAIAAFGGGLAFLALKTSPEETIPRLSDPAETIGLPDETTRSEAASEDAPRPTTLATIQDVPRSATTRGGAARYWEVIPMNALGQRIDSAVVTATPADELEGAAAALEATGRTRWTSVPAGTWSLKVEVEGEPTWTREVLVEADDALRTPVYVGNELRITGEVRDSNGAPLPRNTPVFLLPKGAQHPTEEELQRDVKTGIQGTTDGAIAVQTDAAGRFKTRLPEAGEYRISVGTPRGNDAVRWTQPTGVELTYGGPDHVITTVPARAEMTVRFAGPKEERPTAMSAYIFDAERAAMMQAQTQARNVRSDQPAQTLEEAQRAAKEAALEAAGEGKTGKNGGAGRNGSAGRNGGKGGQRGGTARTMSEENAKMQNADFDSMEGSGQGGDTRVPLFEPGWRSIGSRSVDANGEVVFNDLPTNKDLRFLFVRGAERIATPAPIRMRKEQRAIGSVVLPPPTLEPGFHQNALATLQLKDRPEDPEAPQLKVGVEWKVAGQ
ncbi:hypothetical protein Poly30_19210 [Planctomycetes bacterium Poly30]|uniref:Uncharacterized protein n=1 Tax=Saltatorellus ferox TaxID=2528018 RepID=A0A518EQP7_9BACT|nr:hypothetical protein Poly30_19210 [Planctomycetes bacterium Poly30]